MRDIPTNNKALCDEALVGLYDVYDPEVGLNIVDLGLLYQLDFDESKKTVDVLMTLTTQFCPMGDTITGDTTESLTKSFPEWQINIELTFEPPWEFSKITPEGREYLGQ